MVIGHDFVRFPELTDSQMNFYYFQSPHKQIVEDFNAKVVVVHDGDTVTLETSFRDFQFPLRLSGINAPELNEGGEEALSWLEREISGRNVTIIMNKENRVGKFGRLIGDIMFNGLSMSNTMLNLGLVEDFKRKGEGKLPNPSKFFRSSKWF